MITHYTNRACNLTYRRSRPCVLDVWLVAYNHFHLHHIDSGFFLACGTKQREFHQHSVLIYPRSCFSAANRAVNPSYFVHLFVHPCSFTSGMALHRCVWLFAAVFQIASRCARFTVDLLRLHGCSEHLLGLPQPSVHNSCRSFELSGDFAYRHVLIV